MSVQSGTEVTWRSVQHATTSVMKWFCFATPCISEDFSLLMTQFEATETTEGLVLFICRILTLLRVYFRDKVSRCVLYFVSHNIYSWKEQTPVFWSYCRCIKSTTVHVSFPTSDASLLVSDVCQIRPPLPEVIRESRCWRLHYNKAWFLITPSVNDYLSRIISYYHA